MKCKLMTLSRRYEAALRKHLGQSHRVGTRISRASLGAAQGLGRQAVATGLEPLEMARLHEQALVALDGQGERLPARAGAARGKLASDFFAEAISPIEETHLTARRARAHLSELNKTLRRRTVELADSNRRLKRRIAKRKTAEEALRQSRGHQTKLLKESLRLERSLRRLTHRLLAGHENERKKISRELRDEIAQTLLGINVRLLSLKADATVNTEGLQKEIASTQELVARSAKSVRRVARGLERGK